LVDYEDIPDSQGVLETLDSGRGDCTEFADLFTTLARSIGIPTQTVFGIVYEAGELPKMAFHAWNEIQINEKLLEIDPTWQQIPADGSHIRLSQKTINRFQSYPEKEIKYSVDYAGY
jgi:transglutaminase-like putative cysteine protease